MLKPCTAVLILCSVSAVAAQDIRPAGEDEIKAALAGCWVRESSYQAILNREAGYVLDHEICFGSDGQLETMIVGGLVKWGLEGIGTRGRFDVMDDRLHLVGGGNSDGWVFDSNELSCDLVMRPGVAMKLSGCVGTDGELFADTSYSKVRE